MENGIKWLDEKSGWLGGYVRLNEGEVYSFEAKVLENASRLGLNGTEIIKMIVWYGEEFSIKKTLLNYDEGWDIRVSNPVEEELMSLVMGVVTERREYL